MKATEHHLQRMVRRHRSFSGAARALGIDPRLLRRNRRDMKNPTRRLIVAAGKLLALQELVKQLRVQGMVSDDQLRAVWAAQAMMKSPNTTTRNLATKVTNRRGEHDGTSA